MIRCDREVLRASSATGGNERNPYLSTNGVDHLGVEALGDAVGVHGVQKNLSGTELCASNRPGDGVDPGRGTSSVSGDLVA